MRELARLEPDGPVVGCSPGSSRAPSPVRAHAVLTNGVLREGVPLRPSGPGLHPTPPVRFAFTAFVINRPSLDFTNVLDGDRTGGTEGDGRAASRATVALGDRTRPARASVVREFFGLPPGPDRLLEMVDAGRAAVDDDLP